MKLLDLTWPLPAENLAGDEALLDAAEAGENGEVLRFWESPQPFVVVGYANKVATEVNVAACEARDIPILRRCTGGGTVVQGPGCLNYALVLRIEAAGPTRSISAANHFIMERNRVAVETLLRSSRREEAQTKSPAPTPDRRFDPSRLASAVTARIEIRGHTDLTLAGLKFSGNSQRRRRQFLLFHGTFLLNFDLPLVSELLRMPSQQPDYRQSRAHEEFLTNLNCPAEPVKSALCKSWGATTKARPPAPPNLRALAEKYSSTDWNRKF